MDNHPQDTSSSRLSPPSSIPQQLQSHLYEAFLKGETADISVRVYGWNTIYKLHRIVLTQAGFFHSLFTSGFSESTSNANIVQGEVRLRFDHDPNITRAAFEICLARLYGGGPTLYVQSNLFPTASEPLTLAYTQPWQEAQPVPNGHHPASPRFLLSLLSTAFYLSIPTFASEIMNLILSTVGPTTVVRYLDYALGKGIGPASTTEPERAAGIEHIGQDFDASSIYTHRTETTEASSIMEDTVEDLDGKLGEMNVKPSEPIFLYGSVSNKVGEACAAFLTRWGIDLLELERQQSPNQAISPAPLPFSQYQPISASSSITWKPASPPMGIWSQGLSAEWVRGILSSDELFVSNEMKRYEASKQVVDMRRRLKGIVPAEEKEWEILFREGIYYSHFSWDELLQLSEDRSPVTGKPYVPLSRFQAAHWSFSKLRQLITKPDSSRSELKLGLEIDTANITSPSSKKSGDSHDVYWPVPIDTSLRIGDPGSAAPTEDLFDPSPPKRRSITAKNFFGIGNPRQRKDEISSSSAGGKEVRMWVPLEPFRFSVEFWGVESLKEKTRLYSHTVWYAGSCYNVYTQVVRKKGLQLGLYLHRQSNVDPIPPASAPRSSQIHPSPSVWHPSLPTMDSYTSNNVSSITLAQNSRPHLRTSQSTEPGSPRGTTPGPSSRSHRSSTPVAIPRSPSSRYIHSNSSFSNSPPTSPLSSPGSQPNTGTSTSQFTSVAPPHQPYRDPRQAVSAYFSIACHSSTGASLTRFSSAPDTFAVSQSWGWKSSSLDVGEGEEQSIHERSLRATVVIGLV